VNSPQEPSPASHGAKRKPLATDALIQELNFGNFVKDSTELENIISKCESVLNVQGQTANPIEHIEQTLNFVRALWQKYDCAEIAEIYAKFVKIEEALFGLERDEKEGTRYREHFVHMFNCYVFGTRIISKFLSQINDDDAKKMLKIDDENLKEVGLPFGSNYTFKQRLFYLWTLIATFHDIAIPFQHLTGMAKGINKFVEEFGWLFTNPGVAMKDYDAAQLHYYFHLLSGIYGGNLELIETGRKYRRPDRQHHYLAKILGREFDFRNHSVLSGFFMWKTVEEIFLLNRTSKYSTGMDEFNLYTEYVLEQDVARAALAISLHSIGPDRKTKHLPAMFPVRFEHLPLTFLLILSDELQEYLRWEGTTLQKGLKFSSHPYIDMEINHVGGVPVVNLVTSFSLDSKNEDYIINQAKKMCAYQKDPRQIDDLDSAVDFIGKTLKTTLEGKIYLGHGFNLKVQIYKDWTQELYSKDFRSKELAPTKDRK
jgi:hypothetical protein